MLRQLGLMVLVVMLGGAALAQTAEAPERRITVTGEGRVEAVPDMASVTVGVETHAETAGAALVANSEAMTAVFAVLEEAGIARADFQTSQISLNPVWNDRRSEQQGPPEITGYAASNLVTVRVREIAGLGGVLDALGQAGANRLQGIAFELSDPRELLDRARERAVADARAKAELLVAAAGVGLGPVLSISEAAYAPGPMMMRAQAAEMAMDMPVAEGQVSLEARVEMVFALE